MKKNDNVDPAALLIAIIPVASSPLVETGAWDKLNTILAADLLRHAQHEAQPGQPADQQRQGPA